MTIEIEITDHKVLIDTWTHHGKLRDDHNDYFVSYELDIITEKPKRFFMVMRNKKTALSCDITLEQIESILQFIKSKKEEDNKQ